GWARTPVAIMPHPSGCPTPTPDRPSSPFAWTLDGPLRFVSVRMEVGCSWSGQTWSVSGTPNQRIVSQRSREERENEKPPTETKAAGTIGPPMPDQQRRVCAQSGRHVAAVFQGLRFWD